jgi:hypothetical protein
MSHDLWEIAGAGVTLRDGCVALPEHGCYGAADNIAATKYYRVRPCEMDASRVQQTHDSGRSARREEWLRCT